MRGHIAELHDQARSVGIEASAEFEEETQHFARAFAEFIPTNAIAEQLPRTVPNTLPAELYRSGVWLVKQVFTGEKPLLNLDHSNGLFSMDYGIVQVPVAVTEQDSRRSVIEWNVEQYEVLRRILIYSEVTVEFNSESLFGKGVVRKLPNIFPTKNPLLPLNSTV
jgi:hypothetical protein